MASDRQIKLQKRGGKSIYSGRRRDSVKKSGFVSHKTATGGRIREFTSSVYVVEPGAPIVLEFSLPEIQSGKFSGFGFYYRSKSKLSLDCSEGWFSKRFYSDHGHSNSFNKCGYIWRESHPESFSISISAQEKCEVEVYGIGCGEVWHDFFEGAREGVMKNLHQFSPEANFYTKQGKVVVSGVPLNVGRQITLKECNRCARYLPINVHFERDTLSFSNHCVSRRPCRHRGFGVVDNIDSGRPVQFEYGFQLECRFCKKFVVNAPLNCQRTADQKKEDAQRRRHFELLIAEMQGVSAQLNFRHTHGKELTTFIWEKFDKKCFKCSTVLETSNEMHLDHTRPLALLWPLDETATALCGSCNSSKRDRHPKDFYTEAELLKLSEITGIGIDSLNNPEPNLTVLSEVLKRSKWLVEEFLNKDFLLEEREGKISSELICKSLDRVLAISKLKADGFSFVEEFHLYFRK